MATTAELIGYYSNLLILQYIRLPKARGTVQATVKPIIMDQLPRKVQNAFDLSSAVGVQLDVVGKYVGVKRTNNSFLGPVTLNDSDFRNLIYLAALKNSAGSSLYDIQTYLSIYFSGQILISDNATMGINYLIVDSLGSQEFLEVLITGDFLPRPMAVGVSATIIPVLVGNLFAFRTYLVPAPGNTSPMNSYGMYMTNYPWLSYST